MVYRNANEVYHSYLLDILTNENAVVKMSRAGMTVGTAGEKMQFDLSQGVPLINTKRLFTRGVIHELAWFLNGTAPDGELHIDYLVKNKCDFWTGNLFDFYNVKRGFKEPKYSPKWESEYADFGQKLLVDPEFAALHGSLGRPYSAQWRTWRSSDINSAEDQKAYVDKHEDWINQFGKDGAVANLRRERVQKHAQHKTVDQLANALDQVRAKSDSRRIIVEAWRPDELANMALPPCHKDIQFVVMNDRLDILMHQRSCDSFLGVPFNIACYAMLGTWAAKLAGLKPGVFTHFLADTHIYCGDTVQGAWYKDNFAQIQDRLRAVKQPADYLSIKEWIEAESPKGKIEPGKGKESFDHLTAVLTQLSQDTKAHPMATLDVVVDSSKSSKELLDTVKFEDFTVSGYNEKDYKFIPRRMPV